MGKPPSSSIPGALGCSCSNQNTCSELCLLSGAPEQARKRKELPANCSIAPLALIKNQHLSGEVQFPASRSCAGVCQKAPQYQPLLCPITHSSDAWAGSRAHSPKETPAALPALQGLFHGLAGQVEAARVERCPPLPSTHIPVQQENQIPPGRSE